VDNLMTVFPIFFTLIICVLNAYSMCSYRIPPKQANLWFLLVTLVCMAFNSYIILSFGLYTFRMLMLFTIAVPYFLMILFISKDKISQTFFNVWFWINIFIVINNVVQFINDITFRSYGFAYILRVLLFCVYFILYHKFIKKHHRMVIEKLKVNWWVFSLVPVLFTVLVWMINYYYNDNGALSRNYPLLFVIFIIMICVYLIIAYSLRTINNSMKLELSQAALSQHLDAAKGQIAFLNETQLQTSIYQHNMRHHLTAIDGFLSTDKVQQAKEYIRKVQEDIEYITPKYFCENELVNMLCASFSERAERMGISLTIKAKLSDILSVSDTELCALLSNGLENALNAVDKLANNRWIELYCEVKQNKLLIQIKNPYSGEIVIEGGLPVSQRENHGYGCYSIRAITESLRGICSFETSNNIFILRIMLPL